MMTSQPATEEERHLAAQAQTEFETCKYDACAATLSKLISSRGTEAKIVHNKGLLEYCKTKMTKTEEFRKALREACTKASLNLDQVDKLDDADQSIFFYNHAVILYHLRQYKKALVILDKLFQFIEPMDDGLSRKIMFFLIELYIQTHQPKEAMGMISYVEKALLSGKPPQTPDTKDANSASSKETTANEEALRSTISQYKARCFIVWKSLKNCKREVKALMTSTNNGMTAPLIYLKANIECLRGNYRKAIKVLNSAPPSTPSPSAGVSPREVGENMPMMYQNNMAVIHFHMRKHHLGAMYLRRAIDENTRATKDLCKVDLSKSLNGVPLASLGLSRHYELLYNMGIQMLHCGQPEPAFDCLIETIQLYQINPRLWLRLAECCIMAHKGTNDEDRSLEKKLSVLRGSVGSGLHRKLILGTGIDQASKISVDSPALPSTTLEFASLCLKNALLLLPQESVTPSPTPQAATSSTPGGTDNMDADSKSGGDTVLVAAPPSSPLRGTGEVEALRCSVLAAAAYVSLCLNDWVHARSYAAALLREARLSPAQRHRLVLYGG